MMGNAKNLSCIFNTSRSMSQDDILVRFSGISEHSDFTIYKNLAGEDSVLIILSAQVNFI